MSIYTFLKDEINNLSEREILKIFYETTNGVNWYRNDNWCTDKPLEEWYGIKVNRNLNNRFLSNNFIVTEIDLKNNNLNGSLSGVIGHLRNLTILKLDINRLTNKLPIGLFNLKKLKILNFRENYFKGKIPREICNLENIEKINLSLNKLSGKIPNSMCKLKKLNELLLNCNLLNGRIPKGLLYLPNFEVLFIHQNFYQKKYLQLIKVQYYIKQCREKNCKTIFFTLDEQFLNTYWRKMD